MGIALATARALEAPPLVRTNRHPGEVACNLHAIAMMSLFSRCASSSLAVLISVAALAEPIEDDPVRDLAPGDATPYTAAVEAKIRIEAGACLEEGRPALALGGATERRERLFTACMEKKGYVRVPRPDSEALRVLGRVADCLDGHGLGCAEAVLTYVQGVPGTSVRLVPYEGVLAGRKLCRSGDGEVCLALASLYLTGFGDWEADPREALQIAEEGCAVEHPGSCAFAGALLVGDHHGVDLDRVRGGKLLAKACAGGVSQACAWPPSAPPRLDAKLAAGHRWCRYATPRQGCAPVVWVAVPDATACASDVSFGVPPCRYDLDPVATAENPK